MALSRFARYRTQARFFMPIPFRIVSSDGDRSQTQNSWADTGAPPLQLKIYIMLL
ncbi:MAG: hypothetical protein HC789_16940 [Microcoleus sp. CSU_2_2]|nr:hypothetical protein [Microcoleus sp. SU_5_3]NJS11934.1 hypothetical protein [Microcoleus sp. CSU_2_2]